MNERATINISVPDSMRRWIEKVVAKGGYGTVSEYFRELVRSDHHRRGREDIEAKLLKTIDTDPSSPMTQADWDRIRNRLRERVARRRARKTNK